MTILVVMSPCALVISTPASTLSALANAARHGILFKGGAYLEAAGSIPIIAFDKTGTLTLGRPTLTAAISLDPALTDDELVQLAASVERLLRAPHRQGDPGGDAAARDAAAAGRRFAAKPGHGVSAEVDGRLYWVGNATLMREFGIPATIDHTRRAQAARQRQDGRLRDR